MPAGFVVQSFSELHAENDGDDGAEDYLGTAGDALDDATDFSKRSVLEVDLAGHLGCCVCVVG